MKNLKILRLNKNLSQETVADDLKISQSALSLYERGKREPDQAMLVRLANYYGVTTDYLLGNEKKPVNTGKFNDAKSAKEYLDSLGVVLFAFSGDDANNDLIIEVANEEFKSRNSKIIVNKDD